MVMSFNELFVGVWQCHLEERRVMTVSAGWRQSRFLQHHSHACWDIGFTDNSNPFYLFSKLNTGLLLWAPFAPMMRAEQPLLITLEAERRILMSIHHTSRTGDRVESHADALVSDRLADRRETDESQIARPQFVEAHGFFTVGGR